MNKKLLFLLTLIFGGYTQINASEELNASEGLMQHPEELAASTPTAVQMDASSITENPTAGQQAKEKEADIVFSNLWSSFKLAVVGFAGLFLSKETIEKISKVTQLIAPVIAALTPIVNAHPVAAVVAAVVVAATIFWGIASGTIKQVATRSISKIGLTAVAGGAGIGTGTATTFWLHYKGISWETSCFVGFLITGATLFLEKYILSFFTAAEKFKREQRKAIITEEGWGFQKFVNDSWEQAKSFVNPEQKPAKKPLITPFRIAMALLVTSFICGITMYIFDVFSIRTNLNKSYADIEWKLP